MAAVRDDPRAAQAGMDRVRGIRVRTTRLVYSIDACCWMAAGRSKMHMKTRYNPYMSKANRMKKLMMRLIVLVGRWDLSEREGAGGAPIYSQILDHAFL